MIILTGCRPEGALEVTRAGPSMLSFHISKTDDEDARCIRSLSIYSLDGHLNYTDRDKVYEHGDPGGRCVDRLQVQLDIAKSCEIGGCNYRAVSRNGVYVYSTDFQYDGTLLQ